MGYTEEVGQGTNRKGKSKILTNNRSYKYSGLKSRKTGQVLALARGWGAALPVFCHQGWAGQGRPWHCGKVRGSDDDRSFYVSAQWSLGPWRPEGRGGQSRWYVSCSYCAVYCFRAGEPSSLLRPSCIPLLPLSPLPHLPLSLLL